MSDSNNDLVSQVCDPSASIPESLRAKWKADDELRARLLQNIQQRLPELKALLDAGEGHWGLEDAVYRFYHHSFKVYRAQQHTQRIVDALRTLLPDREMDSDFLTIVKEGTEKEFQLEHNQEWLRHTRPILEALFHAQYFLRMACKYGGELKEVPQVMPSGWAALLYLYNLR